MEQLFIKLQNDLDQLLVEADEQQIVILRLELCIKSARGILYQLRDYVITNHFNSIEEEIYFFKTVKPYFNSRFIYYLSIYELECRKPNTKGKEFKRFVETEKKMLNSFLHSNHSFFHYYRSGSDHLDHIYFVREHFDVRSNPDALGIDPVFSTSHDYKLAKIMAAEMLLVHLQNLKAENAGGIINIENSSKLKWTGDVINLVELAFGIWLTQQVNNGEATLTDIVRSLEDMFKVKIDQPHRRWVEISQRKRLSFTRYLDIMKNAILQRIETGLELK